MKIRRTYIFIAISSVALLLVLLIQVHWILQTAQIKEDLFNEKANMVLAKTAEDIRKDQVTCGNLQSSAGKNDIHKVDSLLAHYLQAYNIHVSYTFDVKPAGPPQTDEPFKSSKVFNGHSYAICVTDEADRNALQFKLNFPEKRQFILAEMGSMFITSVVLILLVLIVSVRTILSLMKEKSISEHTSDYLNNMTHEFKTPLTNIALAGKMMVKESNLKEVNKIKHYSAIILEENEKLRLQVEQVLSMTALERGEIPLQKTELDMHLLIGDSLKCMSVQVENMHGETHMGLRAENVVVMGDKTHLINALCNLLDNAIKYAGGKPELRIETKNDNGNIVITLADKGIGIEKEYQKKVFEKFFRVPTGNVHDVKGFGLGLAYVKKIIELHGGTISLQSEKGNGTIFTITLPNA